ncbi:hypothetical protein MWH25_06495 [Natroniella acetigena]|uniref:hypothetical protein n=1 Tax=Natroniella acetigena TaxID=52004 RepID=UPI00200AF376|nr:hypothetical protein [Natroniella acetigena]MCK8827392.1 hypothetical protein [Natroniella acetigena]
MQLIEILKKRNQKDLSQIAANHHIYYDPNFSKTWVSKEINKKLSDPTYLEELIKTKFPAKTISTLKRLISTEPINKKSLQLSAYEMLIESGLIFEQNNFCYLPTDIKQLLTKLLANKPANSSKSSKEPNITETNEQESIPNAATTKIKIKCTPSFFHYLLLFLGYITTSVDLKEDRLKNFTSKLNCSSISNQKLFNSLQQYSSHNQLLERSTYKLRDNINKWLNISYKEKLLTGLETLSPNHAPKIRNTIAVLSHYPLQQQIPFDFFINEINYRKSDLTQLKLLELMKIFTIENEHVKLTRLCWKLFNSKTKCNLIKPKINNNQILIAENTELKSLWSVFQTDSLLEITDNLELKINERDLNLIL